MKQPYVILADDWGGGRIPNYVVWTDPISGEERSISGELVDGDYRKRRYFSFDGKKYHPCSFYDSDIITHVAVYTDWEDWENMKGMYLVIVPYTSTI